MTRKTIFSTNAALTGTWNEIKSEDVVKVEEGEQLLIRVYPWSGQVENGRWICISDVAVSGQSKDAAGVNITGSISYKLDKGGLNQGDDVVFDPETLSAGFVGKTWSAGSALTVEGTIQYVGKNDEKTNQTKIYNGTDGSFSSSGGADNALTLTLTPEDGFTFVPSKVSFKAARYGTDGGNIGAAVKAGDKEAVIVDNKGVNRGGKSLDIASFSEEVDGIYATADKPLELSFYFLNLGKTKSMGLSNVVIEGQLVGAAQHTAGIGDKVLHRKSELELLAELQEILQRLVDLAEYPVFPLDGYIIAEEAVVAAAVAGVHDSDGTAHSNSFLYPPFCFFHNSGPVAFIQGGDIIQHLVFPGQVIGVYGKACFLEGISYFDKLLD